ncbi:MAG: MBL fold metallo-hydrolase [Halioglobus sp.]
MDWKNTLWTTLFWLATAVSLKANALEITFIDVGEGEAIFLESAGHTALIDSGNPLSGGQTAAFLNARGLKSLDTIIITHPHLDHLGGVFQLLSHFIFDQRYDNGQNPDPENDLYRWYREAYRSDNYRILKAGDRLTLGDAHLQVLNAVQQKRTNWNQNSIVLMLSHGNSRALLMADADTSVERELIASGVPLKASLLKLGHHGHSDATSTEFLEHVDPEYAVISINRDNLRGYPSAEILNRLDNYSVQSLMTYKLGDITFRSDGERFYRLER